MKTQAAILDLAERIDQIELKLIENQKSINQLKIDRNNYVNIPQLYGIMYEAIYTFCP